MNTTQQEIEKIVMEFDERFGVYWGKVGNTLYRAFPDTNERPVIIPQESIRNFLLSSLSKMRQATIEEAKSVMPIQKIHQLPDDVGSPHETEYDRGWNDYNKEALLRLQDLQGK